MFRTRGMLAMRRCRSIVNNGKDGVDHPASEDAAQSVALTTAQAAIILAVDTRTVRRYITDGICGPGGVAMRLPARQVRTKSGHEWQFSKDDLEVFAAVRATQATEGEDSQSIAVAAIQMISTELERRGVEMERQQAALREAHDTIERLATERGQMEGYNEALQRENEALRLHLAEVEQQQPHTPQRRGRGILPRG